MDRNVTINAVDVLGQVGARFVAESRYVVASAHLRYRHCAPLALSGTRRITSCSAVMGESQCAPTTRISQCCPTQQGVTPAAVAACAPAAASLRASSDRSRDWAGAQWQSTGLRERHDHRLGHGLSLMSDRTDMDGADMGKKRPMSLKRSDRQCASMHRRTTGA